MMVMIPTPGLCSRSQPPSVITMSNTADAMSTNAMIAFVDFA